MILNNKKKSTLMLTIIMLSIIIISILFKSSLFMIAELTVIAAFIGVYIYIDEKRLMYALILSTLIGNYVSKFSSVLSYIPYIVTLMIFVKILEKRFILRNKIRGDRFIIGITFLIFIINILALMYNRYELNPLLLLFYSIKKFGYIILYIFFVNLDIEKDKVFKIYKFFIYFAIIQIPFIVVQFFQGITQDNITGLFGDNTTGILLQYLLYCMVAIMSYKNKIINNNEFDFIFMISCILYSAIAEVKIGFIVVPFIYIIALVFKRRFIKLASTICILLVSFNLIYGLFIQLYPEHDFLGNMDFTKKYISNAYGIKSVNRTGFMPVLEDTILDSTEKIMFGTGLATLNPSKMEILEGQALDQYSYLNLHFFTLPYLLAENGIVGTCLWLLIYIYILITNIYFYIKKRDDDSIIIIMSIIVTLIFIYYNSSIITSSTIIMMIWFIIAFFNNKKIKVIYK